jgi:methylated-DNA-[protein]-cysteine S-methyltransferase
MRQSREKVPTKAFFVSPIGPVRLEVWEGRVARIDFARGQFRSRAVPDATTAGAVRQLDEYFEGARRDFDMDLDLDGTEFQEQVWRALGRIPFGETRTYGQVAAAIGRPAAARAVGAACNANPISIVVPCHRVVGAGGDLVGYGGGMWRKRWLLEHEAKHA